MPGVHSQRCHTLKNIAEYSLISGGVFENFPKIPAETFNTELTKIKELENELRKFFLFLHMADQMYFHIPT